MSLLGKLWIYIFNAVLFLSADALFDPKKYPIIEAEQLLSQDLFRYYDISVRPTENVTKPVTVSLSISVVDIIQMEEDTQVLDMVIWVRKTWTDVRLQWNASNYAGVTQLNIPSNNIWIPDIIPFNKVEASYTVEDDSLAVVKSDGMVMWFPALRLMITCQADLTNFPYDEQVCSVMFGSWTYDGRKVNLTFDGPQESALHVEPNLNEDWTVVNKTAVINRKMYACCPDPFPDLTITLNLKRNPSFFSHMFIVPAIFLGLLVPVQLLLPPASKERLTLGSVLLVSMLYMNFSLLHTLPRVRSTVPTIQLYYLITLVWNILALMASVLALNAQNRGVRQSRVPAIIRTIFLDKLKKFVCVNDSQPSMAKGIDNLAVQSSVPYDGQPGSQDTRVASISTNENDQLSNMAAINESKQKILSEWHQLALVLDRVLFIFFFVIYLICSITLVK